ncbi:Nucleic acid-binding OB-fold [Penicillium taxi]|uniref:Nucleic acid-binding OB-fold n=1 Tax=Penicillium taxi TaxID=168475 RepID=UPI002544E607|nr:Nucleic acid-binding OB-fold [Penicillium taxi]KAJ5887705.1 Nucleic acid-binding OB-fold [Penicillium taxi]
MLCVKNQTTNQQNVKILRNLSDLLDTHQDRPTEVRHRDQTGTLTLQAVGVTVEAEVKRLHFRASRTCSHQQGWRFCGSYKEFRKETSTLKRFFELQVEEKSARPRGWTF